jgi:hypothetical protein
MTPLVSKNTSPYYQSMSPKKVTKIGKTEYLISGNMVPKD